VPHSSGLRRLENESDDITSRSERPAGSVDFTDRWQEEKTERIRQRYFSHIFKPQGYFSPATPEPDKQHASPEKNAAEAPAQQPACEGVSPTNTTFPNSEKTRTLFCFYNNGIKEIKSGGKRTYYKYKEPKCEAKYTHTKVDSNGSPTESCTFAPEPHNHPPPPEPPINPDVKERSIAHLRVSASPANVHKQLVKEAPLPLSSADVPTPGMLRVWKHRDAYKDMESSTIARPYCCNVYFAYDFLDDVITNITARHKYFVRKIEMHPAIFIVAVSDFGMRIFLFIFYFRLKLVIDTREVS
jgi:hypothetical protein